MGVYLLKDEKENIIFVNMARNLANDVRKHFHSSKRLDLIIKSKTRSIEVHVKEDEFEAVKLELELIKKYHPLLNLRGYDQKQYRFIEISTAETYPTVNLRKVMNETKPVKIIGPFPKKSSIRKLFNFAVNYFEIADCRQKIVTGRKNKIVNTCLRRKTKQCCRPCEVEIDPNYYDKKINEFNNFLEGGFPEIIDELQIKMKEYGDKYEFEKAALVRDDINSIIDLIKFK